MFKSVQGITQSNNLNRPFRECQVSLGKKKEKEKVQSLKKLPLLPCFLERLSRCTGGRGCDWWVCSLGRSHDVIPECLGTLVSWNLWFGPLSLVRTRRAPWLWPHRDSCWLFPPVSTTWCPFRPCFRVTLACLSWHQGDLASIPHRNWGWTSEGVLGAIYFWGCILGRLWAELPAPLPTV